MDIARLAETTQDTLTVRKVFGEAYERDGTTVIPAATIRGGAGGGGSRRIRGLTLTATDLDRTAGSGPVLEGPAESLLMAIAGRRGTVEELTGPGQSRIAERIVD